MPRFLLFALLMLSGCTYSTNPIFTEQDNVFDKAFIGTWKADDGIPDVGTFEVTRWATDDNSYRVVLRNQANEKQGTFQLYLSQIDRTKYLTARVEADKSTGSVGAVPAHAIYWTLIIDQQDGEQLKARYLQQAWIIQQINSNPQVLKHEWYAHPDKPDKKNHILLTATTAELRAFVLSHTDKRDAWMPVRFKKIR